MKLHATFATLFFIVASCLSSSLAADDKIPPLPRKIAFGEVHEVTLYGDNPEYLELGHCLIDFDAHKTFPVTELVTDAPHSEFLKKMKEKMRAKGVDAYCELKTSFAGLLGFGVVAFPVREKDWDPNFGTMEQLTQTEIGFPCAIAASRRLPATWIFRTSKSYGVLQITEIVDAPDDHLKGRGAGIRIRYKLVKPTE